MIVYQTDYTTEQLNIISALAKKFGISQKLAKIIFSRGINTEEKMRKYLHPGKQNFLNPFLLKGVSEAVERITFARDNGERVLVFGDYDADGICATTVLANCLRDFGIRKIFTVIPERSQGYGLTHDLVEQMLEECEPDLVITVDCGISCKEEVAFIEDVGVDVIVTDHHEIPDEIPDCTVINCKLKDQDYPFDALCGAGVAYKLGYALIGSRANEYLDLVSIATIADSMPLLEENRDIVFEGLKLIKNLKNPAIAKLVEVSGLKEVTSTGLAFTVAPRINAAGRMGNANCALDLLLESDLKEISNYCNRLNDYNAQRQNECDKLLKSAKAKIEKEGLAEKVIVLHDDEWNGGLVGIVAAKLVEEFSRPVVLFTKTDKYYHGSARSIESINIFQAVNACKHLLVEFGGHAQAAGITVSEQNLPLFAKELAKFIDENYTSDYFASSLEVEDIISERFTVDFAKELTLLEPFGTGNRKPLFCVKAENVNASPLKPGSPHLGFRTEYIDLLYFNGAKDLEIINSPAEKHIVFEPNVSVFNGRESLKGYVRSFEYKIVNGERLILDGFKNYLLTVFNSGEYDKTLDNELIEQLIAKYRNDGTAIFAVSDVNNLRKYKLGKMKCSLYYPQGKTVEAELVVGLKDCNASTIEKVIYLDIPFGNIATVGNCKNYAVANCLAFDGIQLSTEKSVFAEVFKILKLNRFYGKSSVDVALGIVNENISQHQIIFCLEVFLELGIFSFAQGSLQLNGKVKSDLTVSKIYCAVRDKNL